MKSISGFSLVELLLAIGLTTLVVGTTTSLIHYYFAEQKNLDVWSSGQLEMSMALKSIEGDMRNVVRIDPNENLYVTTSPRFFGMTGINEGDQPSECLSGPGASVIRYTSLDRSKRSERLQRPWSEKGDAGLSGPNHELRISADYTDKSLFREATAPREIILVDADRRYIRRYAVVAHAMKLNSSLDPYDDTPKVDTAGNAVVFNYATARLNSPMNAKNAFVDKIPAVFVTGSEVYESNTFYLCLRASDRSLIKINQNSQEVSILLQNNNIDFEIDSFNVGYLSTKGGLRVEQASFIEDMINSPQNLCFNTVRFEIRLRPTVVTTRRNANVSVRDTKTAIVRDRTVFSQNLNINRPISCL